MGLEIASAIGLAAFQAGAGVGLANAITFGLANAGGLLFSLGSIAVQALTNNRPNLAPDAQGIQQLIRQAIPAQRLVFGEPVTSGPLFFAKSKPPYTWYGILLAAHEIEGFQSLYINGQEVFIGPDGFATSTPFRDGANKYLEVSVRNGLIDQAIDPIIARDFPTMPSTFRQRGHATIVMKRTHGFGSNIEEKNEDHRRVWGDSGVFNPLIRFRGAKIYDPRKPGQVQANKSTHAYSNNAALCLAHALTFQWPDKRIFEPSRLNWDMFAEAADICDKWEVDRNGNTFRRYTADGVIEAGNGIVEIIESFATAMGGSVAIERGKIYPIAGARQEPSYTLHNRMVTGGFQYQPEKDTSQLVNIVKTQFQAPDRGYQTVEGPVLKDDASITADGRPLEADIALSWVQGDPRAQRLAHMALKQARAQKELTIGVTLEALPWQIGKVVRVALSGGVLEKPNGLYVLTGKRWNEDMRGYQLTLKEYTDEAFNFGPANEQDFVLDDATLEAEAA